MRRQVDRLVLAVLLGQGALGITASSAHAAPAPTPDPSADGRTAYCLKDENAGPLVDTAEALRIAGKGKDGDHVRVLENGSEKDLSIEDWAYGGDWRGFQQACAALASERRLPAASSGSWWGQVSSLVTGAFLAILGALAGLATTLVSTGKAERRRVAGDMHKAIHAYFRACRACLTAWRTGNGRRLEKDMDAPFDVLLVELEQCQIRHRRWKLAEIISGDLKKLDEDIRKTEWPTLEEGDERKDAVQQYSDRLGEVLDKGIRLASGMERMVFGHRRMRKP